MAKRKYGASQINLLSKSQPKTQTTTSVAPVILKECKQLIYNIFAKPKYNELKITKRAYIKLMCYINLIGDYEISGFGRIQDGIITDFKILKQQVRGTYVECSDDAVMQFIRNLPREQLSEWELDWHSHVNMGTHPSGTDWKNYEDMSALRGNKQFPVMIINKKQEYTLMNYIAEDNSPDIDLVITNEDIENKEIDEIYEEVKRDIKENCDRLVTIQQSKTNVTTIKTNKEKTSYPVYDDYMKYQSSNWWADYDKADDNDFIGFNCKSCGTQLLNSHELTTGLCEECEEAVGK